MKESDVARKYDVNPSSVTRWKQMLEEEGIEGLKRRKAQGAKSKLSEDQQKNLKEIILQGAAAYRYKTDLWTLRRVAEVIEKGFDVSYHSRSLSDVLHWIGLLVLRNLQEGLQSVIKWQFRLG